MLCLYAESQKAPRKTDKSRVFFLPLFFSVLEISPAHSLFCWADSRTRSMLFVLLLATIGVISASAQDSSSLLCGNLTNCGSCLEVLDANGTNACQWCFFGKTSRAAGSCLPAGSKCERTSHNQTNVVITEQGFCNFPEVQNCFKHTLTGRSKACVGDSRCIWVTSGKFNGRSLNNFSQSGAWPYAAFCWTGSPFNARLTDIPGYQVVAKIFFWSTTDIRGDHFLLITFLTPALVLLLILVLALLIVVIRAIRRGRSWQEDMKLWFFTDNRNNYETINDDQLQTSNNWDHYLQGERERSAKVTQEQEQEERALIEETRAQALRDKMRKRHKAQPIL